MDESAGLENRCTGNCTVGSNPTLSAGISYTAWLEYGLLTLRRHFARRCPRLISTPDFELLPRFRRFRLLARGAGPGRITRYPAPANETEPALEARVERPGCSRNPTPLRYQPESTSINQNQPVRRAGLTTAPATRFTRKYPSGGILSIHVKNPPSAPFQPLDAPVTGA